MRKRNASLKRRARITYVGPSPKCKCAGLSWVVGSGKSFGRLEVGLGIWNSCGAAVQMQEVAGAPSLLSYPDDLNLRWEARPITYLPAARNVKHHLSNHRVSCKTGHRRINGLFSSAHDVLVTCPSLDYLVSSQLNGR